MADGLCSGDPVGGVIEKTQVKDYDEVVGCDGSDSVGRGPSAAVNSFFVKSDSEKLFQKLCGASVDEAAKHEGFLPCEEDCRKKRCVDRYDSSESSDSGVAVLSCTDCSGSSTASSDITDPGSPFSTASSHSEDSASQPTKMPPTQTAHHPPWPWTAEEGPPIKRSMLQEKTAFPKRLKSDEDNSSKQSPLCLNTSSHLNNNNINVTKTSSGLKCQTAAPDPASPNDTKLLTKSKLSRKLDLQTQTTKQGKITEYFKSQMKLHMIKKDMPKNADGCVKTAAANLNAKFVSLVDQQTQFNGIRPQNRGNSANKKSDVSNKGRKLSQVTVPRKILPAPSKLPDNHHSHHAGHHVGNIANFTPTVTLTAVSFPPNLTYLHTKTPKPPDNNSIFVPQFATISSDKISAIPIINRTPCLNVIQPVQKITTINNFNCVKLNATVVPIVKLNTLPSRLNGNNLTLSVETAVPTVLTAKPKECPVPQPPPIIATNTTNLVAPKQHTTPSPPPPPSTVGSGVETTTTTTTTTITTTTGGVVHQHSTKCRQDAEKSPSPADSDSGISYKDALEVAVAEVVAAVPPQKSPILSQPKTIRFPAKQEVKEDLKDTKPNHLVESGLCRWAECSAQFDTSGALLEHLQVKHVISQATQEQYVCLWLGCKVHGRTSCSRSWLERHVLAHAGTKPFRCIVDGCGQRFNSQLALERHVNGHFTSDGSQNSSTKKSTESAASKLFKRNGKKIRFRRQPWSARMFDFIDSGIMEGLQHKLLTMTQSKIFPHIGDSGVTINLSAQVMARRVEPDGNVKVLVKWSPEDIIPDEWVPEKDYISTKSIPIPSLQPSAKDVLNSRLSPVDSEAKRSQKRRRKPISKQT